MLVQELKTIVPLHLVHGLKNYTMFLECTMLIPPITLFLGALRDLQCKTEE